MNAQRFEELKRVLSSVPDWRFDMTNWNDCACGHATRDEWFRSPGFTSCSDFGRAAAFFGITRGESEALFSGRKGRRITPAEVIQNIDELRARQTPQEDSAVACVRRQAIIEGLLAQANEAAHKLRRVATALAAVFF